jgi:hypothetical protein
MEPTIDLMRLIPAKKQDLVFKLNNVFYGFNDFNLFCLKPKNCSLNQLSINPSLCDLSGYCGLSKDCGLFKDCNFRRVNELLLNLEDNLSFLIEFPYVDKHYRDTYYSFHSSKFANIGKNCIRIHIFEGEEHCRIEECSSREYADSFRAKYLGFFIIRPLQNRIMGRSVISPKALKNNNFVCCLAKFKVYIKGAIFEVCGFPHVAQDTETHSCAESSLWSFVEYYGAKYPQYKTILPSQIIKYLSNDSDKRRLPSAGLSISELTKSLHSNGFQCLSIRIPNEEKRKTLFRMLRIYIESGVPVLLALVSERLSDGHAVLAIGHTNEYNCDGYEKLSDNNWVDTSYFERDVVFIDDNVSPYKIASLDSPTNNPEYKITEFIVPLPSHVFRHAGETISLLDFIFNDSRLGILNSACKFITRTLLTSSNSFKEFVLTDKMVRDEHKNLLLSLNLPKFVWICEIYDGQDKYLNGICSGIILIDTTNIAKVLFCYIKNKLFFFENKNEDVCHKPTNFYFQMGSYQHNLKGEWNKWKS